MSDAALAIRSIQVRRLSALAELGHVLRACIVVAIGACMYLGTDSPIFRGEVVSSANLLPFQQLIQERSTVDQRMFRELQEGLLEAETRRSESGAWPEVSALSAEGIPPFALDPTTKVGPYEWRLVVDGVFINYVGVPQRTGDPAWLVLVSEPVPGAPPDPARDDEEHHRLIDGTMLHVSTWVLPEVGVVPDGVTQSPATQGWTQLYAVGPSLTQPSPAAAAAGG